MCVCYRERCEQIPNAVSQTCLAVFCYNVVKYYAQTRRRGLELQERVSSHIISPHNILPEAPDANTVLCDFCGENNFMKITMKEQELSTAHRRERQT